MGNEDNTQYSLSAHGVEMAMRALMMFRNGKNVAEIESELGVPPTPNEPAGTSVRILVTIADMTGVLGE